MREKIEHAIMFLVVGVLGFICVINFGFWIGSLLSFACGCLLSFVFLKLFSALKARRDTLKSSQNDGRHHE